jgi:L-asparaginase / beta-aspartyl-peptidase
MLDAEPDLLIALGAERFAEEQGAELCDPSELITEKQRWTLEHKQQGHDTVGCVALDEQGMLAGDASIGGLLGHHPGRVGDTALIGCGIYDDVDRGACAMTGVGETITRVRLARTVMDLLDGERDPDEAAQKAIDIHVEHVRGEGGCIVLDRHGRGSWAHNSRDMACAIGRARCPNRPYSREKQHSPRHAQVSTQVRTDRAKPQQLRCVVTGGWPLIKYDAL